jgi:hypothetical protein
MNHPIISLAVFLVLGNLLVVEAGQEGVVDHRQFQDQ